jgi:hypothetical protein
MRADGEVTVFEIEHRYPDGEWRRSDTTHFLLGGLSFSDRRGAIGARRRELTNPLREGWRATGHDGCLEEADGRSLLAALRGLSDDELACHDRERRPEFRLVRRTTTQLTEVVA